MGFEKYFDEEDWAKGLQLMSNRMKVSKRKFRPITGKYFLLVSFARLQKWLSREVLKNTLLELF